MTNTVISVEHLSKRYQLGVINTGTFKDDLKIWLARARGKENPLAMIGEKDFGNPEAETIWALKDVNFTVQRGEALGIIGKNGAGKSTLLKILSRVTAPTEGRVRVKGRIASLLEVGTGFHPELTGRENIYLNGAIMGMSRAEVSRKLDEIIDFSGVEKHIDTPVKRYSSGMYVRLAFAVAAHLEPEILIVDEVLAVGDAEFQKKCLGKMGDVAHEGRTVIFVSHNLQMIKMLCSQGMVLNSGEITLIGNSEIACEKYLNDYSKPELQQINRSKNAAFLAGLEINVTNSEDLNTSLIIDFKIISKKEIKDLSLGFSIHDEKNNTVLIVYSGPKTFFQIKKGTYIVQALINNFSMTPGTYTLRARIESQNDTVDWPTGDLGQFTIAMPKDFFGHRSEVLSNGQLFIRPKWNLKEIREQL